MESAVPIADRTGDECSGSTGMFILTGNFAGKNAVWRFTGFETAHADLRPRYRDSYRHTAGGYGVPAA